LQRFDDVYKQVVNVQGIKCKGYSSLLLLNCQKESQHDYLSSLPRFLAVQHSVQVIQKRWRETLIAREQRVDFLRLRKSVIYIQALWRGQRVRDSLQKVTVLFVGKSGNKHYSFFSNVSVLKGTIYLCLMVTSSQFDLY